MVARLQHLADLLASARLQYLADLLAVACKQLERDPGFHRMATGEPDVVELVHQARRAHRIVIWADSTGRAPWPVDPEVWTALGAAVAKLGPHPKDGGPDTDCPTCAVERAAEALVLEATKARTGGAPAMDQRVIARQQGYTGDACPQCGGFQVRWKGTCKGCDLCPWTGGCS